MLQAGVQRQHDWMDTAPKSVSVILAEAEADAQAQANVRSDSASSVAPLKHITQAQAMADLREQREKRSAAYPLHSTLPGLRMHKLLSYLVIKYEG